MGDPIADRVDQLETALRRAAGVIQGCYASMAKGISGEAIIALAAADALDEPWEVSVEKARKKLEADWPQSK